MRNIQKRLGVIDLSIVCAGTGELNPSLDNELESPSIQTNVVGWTFVVDALFHLFERQGKGHCRRNEKVLRGCYGNTREGQEGI